jgi:hypothetical protein
MSEVKDDAALLVLLPDSPGDIADYKANESDATLIAAQETDVS